MRTKFCLSNTATPKFGPKFAPLKGRHYLGYLPLVSSLDVIPFILDLWQNNQASDGSCIDSVLYLYLSCSYLIISPREYIYYSSNLPERTW